ncbi:MAG TPA: DoxX family protein [Candidatus Baltobacteraceae bacterium]|nr:DoxX family protein [Candidatus Baltobacteraceae bacterium]
MSSVATAEAQSRLAGSKLNVFLWIAQALLALLFLFAGIVKLIMPLAAMAKQTGLPGAFLRFIAVCEALGALGLLLPGIMRVKTGLTALAACGLVIIMIGATWISIVHVSVPAGLFPFIVGVLAAFVAYGRAKLAPLRER